MTDMNKVRPLDVEVGGDADNSGIAQTITDDDIRATLHSAAPLEVRREQLKAMKLDLQARMSADRGGEFEPLIESIDRAIAALDVPAGSAG